MKENAKQGFWNGASPPLGYTIVEAERRGQKIKKHLAVEPVETETVRLIFRLYAVCPSSQCAAAAFAAEDRAHA